MARPPGLLRNTATVAADQTNSNPAATSASALTRLSLARARLRISKTPRSKRVTAGAVVGLPHPRAGAGAVDAMSVRVCDRVTILLTVVFAPHAHFSSGQPCRSIARLDAHSRVFTVRVRVAKVTVAASARDTASAGAPNAPTVRSRAILAVKPGRIAPPFTG